MQTTKSKSISALSSESGTTNFSKHREMERPSAAKNGADEEQFALSLKRSISPFTTDRSYANGQTKDTKLIDSANFDFAGKAVDTKTYITQNKTKVIEVPELRFIDKIEYDPFVIEKLRYVPKQVTKYNIIEKPVIKNIVSEKKVDVLYVQEKISFKDQEIVEEVYNYVDKDNNRILADQGSPSLDRSALPITEMTQGEWDSSALSPHVNSDIRRNSIHNSNNHNDNRNSMGGASDGVLPSLLEPFGPQVNITENKIFENVFIPKVEKVVEVKNKIDIPINLPVPYIVPKPKIVDVDIPVFKFNDKYVPVPIRQRIIPKVTWTDKVYKVDCVVEKPYLVYHDIVKIVPTDTKISVREYPKGITKINPEELYEVDNLALWMRVNADLKEEKDALKKTQDNFSDHTCECSNSDSFEECSSTTELNSYQDGATTIKSSNENVLDTLPIHPGHPLEIVHLQNKWIKQDTTRMQELYQDGFFDAHRNAMFNLGTRIPREAEIEVRQIAQLQRFGEKREYDN
ncbi:inner membrane complex protein 1b, putative [Plasmodium knowlesi strain H]|uniref:Inner membrane complex protein 1b, putative n=3 Tax=Plasmodium knowlesi TaxID=5850 RepID=A0A5K1V1T2_PLAKH|nr:inner membrane complex protein 1b, putative [Plasmodium knowlesi strain H]OTN64960.1 putative Inner membrane complex protein 1b [Plasmodium knowlesi]CAA9988440.1 inner membrane complex protein 1b, putative [Plasmodium knowlesi strain H]SBO19857.1 inner membrane complex protein 1b, putative [Plasmodium knowlesi strain H]SBO20430.1 inner membrane complex protein 1b, putative [Plasmodium knowlesi strain H]VVS77914.1 inner membrane complex protein 1b, putative [Plasmodium knowlesi strain H]|eukprot:XP_002259421.1 Membrane skeletal protein, putative [Plasmodium knowlesi strain H]